MNSLQLLPVRVHWALPRLPLPSDGIRKEDTTPTIARGICHDFHLRGRKMHGDLGTEKGVVLPDGQETKELGILREREVSELPAGNPEHASDQGKNIQAAPLNISREKGEISYEAFH